jgi:hypothetical protein
MAAFILMLVDTGDCTPDNVAHLGSSPESKHQDRRCFPAQVYMKIPGKAEIKNEKPYQNGNNPQGLQIKTAEEPQDRIPAGHKNSKEDAQKGGKNHGGKGDPGGNPQTQKDPLKVYPFN